MNDENQSNENSEGKQEEQTVAVEKSPCEDSGEKSPCEEGGEEEVVPPALEQSTPAAA